MGDIKRDIARGQIFRITRILNDYNQSEMGEFLGISKSFISLIEKGKRSTNEVLLNKYLEHFQVERQTFDKVEKELKKILFGKEVDMIRVGFLVVEMLSKSKK